MQKLRKGHAKAKRTENLRGAMSKSTLNKDRQWGGAVHRFSRVSHLQISPKRGSFANVNPFEQENENSYIANGYGVGKADGECETC